MSKTGKKLIKAAKEAVKVAQSDPRTIKKIKVTPSCGCVFCDLGLKPDENGIHRFKNTKIQSEEPCQLHKN